MSDIIDRPLLGKMGRAFAAGFIAGLVAYVPKLGVVHSFNALKAVLVAALLGALVAGARALVAVLEKGSAPLPKAGI